MIKLTRDAPKVSNKQIWGQLHGCSLSLALAEFCQEKPGIKLLIAPDNLTANQLLSELAFFLADEENNPDILLFPDWETLPYDQFSPHQDIISARMATLHRIQHSTNAIIISAASTLMHRLCPTSFIFKNVLHLELEQTLNLNNFRDYLQQASYRCVNNVLEHGEYAVRGAIIDIYPMGSVNPFRIELLDDTINSLREFDPESQRTIAKINKIHLLPARELAINASTIAEFRQAFKAEFTGNANICPIYKAVSAGQFFAGIEYYLPLFFKETATFFEYLPGTASICLIENTLQYAEAFWQELSKRYEQRSCDITHPIMKTNRCFLTPSEFLGLANKFQQIRYYHEPVAKKGAVYNFNINAAPVIAIERHSKEPLSRLNNYLKTENKRFLLVVESAGRKQVLLDLLNQVGIHPKNQHSWHDFLHDSTAINIITGPLLYGAEFIEQKINIIVEAQLFGEPPVAIKRATQKVIDSDFIIRDLAELKIDTAVVHEQFGIGRYKGLQTIESSGYVNEFLVIAYANEDKIYVPVTSLHCITRYSGLDSEHAPLHKLGGDQWQKEKKRAIEKIHDIAVQLLEIYAKRQASISYAHKFSPAEYKQFASGFAFDETPDQARAIEEVIHDMVSPRPMDRLICGDVGFGKTEVAMRASFIAVQNSKQVCILVPTTLLAAQHLDTFRNRYADFPVKIELLSRFRSGKESAQVIQNLKNGQIDILIGTHKLFAKNIEFKDLGLLIIDEEHRFGVKQKEYIKSLRLNVDVLSMTATPIPRTLNMTMIGIRDISLIATPPPKRLAIKTFWQEKNDFILREAILREILRGGQVYFLHNNINTINHIAHELRRLVPEAHIRIAHGQMRERELESIMSDFYHHHFNVLVCTTIIETGIDIPTANTIIIDRADKLGLAQLHQLRGRVGRSHHQAYAYLLTPNETLLNIDAVKRLQALMSLEDLGAGFTLATHDLEIRGAGELLGESQSGHMQAIGFTLFMELLDKAVSSLKAGETINLVMPMQPQGTEIDLHLSAIIPADYIADVHTRLIMYKRIANAKDQAQLRDLQIEMIDRFGLLPQAAKNLMHITELKLLADKLGVTKIKAIGQKGKIDFKDKPDINPLVLINLIQAQPQYYQMEGPHSLKFTIKSLLDIERITEIQLLLHKLANQAIN